MKTSSMKTLGERIKYYRKKAGIGQKELADAVGVSCASISYYEKNMREVSVPMLQKLAKKLKTTPAALLTADEISKNDEHALMRLYRNLNKLGRERVLEFASILSATTKYTERLI